MISIILNHHLNENDYLLGRAVRSLLEDPCEKEIIVISEAPKPPVISYENTFESKVKIFHYDEPFPCVVGSNMGVEKTSAESLAYMFMGDDCVAIPGSIANLAEQCIKHEMILNPISNCDDLNLVNPDMSGFLREFDPETVDPKLMELQLEKLMHIPSQIPFIFPTHRINFYATIIPKSVWQKVGPLDEQFVRGHDDEDYCLRASFAGFRLGVLSNAFVLHYGQQTLNKVPNPNPERNFMLFHNKYGVMHIPPLTATRFGTVFLGGLRLLNRLEEKLEALEAKKPSP